jgi:LuxR family maltose regulon positive regulatory protein
LDEAIRGPVAIIAAGPGSGKTVLMSTWAGTANMPAAWLSLEAPDDNPERFWSLVGEALLAAGIVAETDSFSALPHDCDDVTPFLAALLDAIPGSANHVIMIDDAHVLTDATVLAELDAVIRYAFPQVRLVLSARSDPLLPLYRYRLSGQMQELRASDLAMTKSETHALLAAHGVTLPRPELALLMQRTEGWTAGLRLSAMSMVGSKHPETFVTQLAVDQGSVGEYLMEEVLDRQTDDVRAMLIQTSFLDEVTGSLAAAVTGIQDSSALLAQLSRTNSFVTSLGRDSDSYRYHQLLSEILRYLLKREYRGKSAELQRRAATWYAEQNQPAAAMRFAIAARDFQRASAILVHGGLARAFVERQDILGLGLGALTDIETETEDDTSFDGDAELFISRAAVAAASGEPDLAKKHLDEVRTADLTSELGATASLVEVMVAHRTGAVGALDDAADQLLKDQAGPDSVRATVGLRAAIRFGQASVRFWDNSPHDEVEALLLTALDEARCDGIVTLELEILGMSQLSYISAGRAEHAKECDAHCLALIRRHPHLQRMTVHHLAHAYGAFMRMDLTASDRSLRRAHQTMTHDADPSTQAAVVMLSAWLLITSGQVAEAHQMLRAAPQLKCSLPGGVVRNQILTLADIETRLGRPHAALKVINAATLGAKDPLAAIISARAHCAFGDADAARRSLRPALVSNEGTSLPLPLLIGALLTSAAVADLHGEEAKAVSELLRATELATELAMQPFTDSRDTLEQLLSRHPEARAAWPQPFVHLHTDPSPLRSNLGSRLFEALTGRETAVLRRLATTMTTAEIADELCVSINTVKTHVAAIYRKLPAAGRRDAVSRARQLELL